MSETAISRLANDLRWEHPAIRDLAISRLEVWCEGGTPVPADDVLWLRRRVFEAARDERGRRGGTVAREAKLVRLAARLQDILDADGVVFPEPPPEPGDDVVPEWFLRDEARSRAVDPEP